MKVLILAALLAVAVVADVPYPTPAYPAYPKASYDYPPRPYNFEYEVNDDPSYNHFGHKEASDGKIVTGRYFVLLPDGRKQIVTYTADANGYVPTVVYEGDAKYDYKPDYKPSYPAPPAYPKPTYP